MDNIHPLAAVVIGAMMLLAADAFVRKEESLYRQFMTALGY
jgi:hypothetical protein